MLFRNRICLALDGTSLDRAQGIARDFRSCTTTVKVGPVFLMAHGPAGVRSLYELGVQDVIVDARLFGNREEVWYSVIEAAKLGARAVTIHPNVGPRIFSLAVEAAAHSMTITKRIRPPMVIGAGLPMAISDRDLCACYGTRHVRKTYVTKHAMLYYRNGASAMLVRHAEMPIVTAQCDELPLLVPVERRVYGYGEVIPADEKGKPCVLEVLRKGAAHAIYDMAFVESDAEWAADMLNKELSQLDYP